MPARLRETDNPTCDRLKSTNRYATGHHGPRARFDKPMEQGRRIKKAPGPVRDPRGAEDNALWDREPVVFRVSGSPLDSVRRGPLLPCRDLPNACQFLAAFTVTQDSIRRIRAVRFVRSYRRIDQRIPRCQCRITPASRFDHQVWLGSRPSVPAMGGRYGRPFAAVKADHARIRNCFLECIC